MKRKLTAAQRELAAAEKALLDKWSNVPKFSRLQVAAPKAKPGIAALTSPVGRETRAIASLSTPGGSCAMPAPKRYTGGNMLGIATLHKSNAVPVFSTEEASDIARMRRG